MEDNLWWKTTFGGRWHLVEDDSTDTNTDSKRIILSCCLVCFTAVLYCLAKVTNFHSFITLQKKAPPLNDRLHNLLTVPTKLICRSSAKSVEYFYSRFKIWKIYVIWLCQHLLTLQKQGICKQSGTATTYWHKLQLCSQCPIRLKTGNYIPGCYFRHYFFSFFSCEAAAWYLVWAPHLWQEFLTYCYAYCC